MRIFFLGVLVLIGIVFSATGQVWAAGSGAYRIEVPDAVAGAMGAAFVGQANIPSAVYWNPAGLTQIKGQQMSVGANLMQTRAEYEDNSGAESQMRHGNFGIPHAYYVAGGERFAFGLGVLTSWGLTTEWNPDSFAKYYATKSTMNNQDYLITGAYKLSDHVSVALSLDIDASDVEKQKKLQQDGAGDSAYDGNFKLKGSSEAVGFRLAGMYQLNERHQFGAMYRSRIEHKYHGKVYLDGMNANPVLDFSSYGLGYLSYQDVFGPGGSYETAVVSKSTLPDSVVVGYSFKPDNKWTFNVDVEWTNWSVVEQEEVAYPDETGALRLAVLNNGNPAPRDWEGSLAFAVGTEYKMAERFRVRGGYYYHQSPIPEANLTASLPDSDSHGVTTGFGYDLNKSLTLDLAWSGLWFNERKVDNGGTQAPTGTYRQWVSMTYATLTYKF